MRSLFGKLACLRCTDLVGGLVEGQFSLGGYLGLFELLRGNVQVLRHFRFGLRSFEIVQESAEGLFDGLVTLSNLRDLSSLSE